MWTQVIIALVLAASCWASEDEGRLFSFIEATSNNHIRPVKDAASALNVTVEFWLFNIHKLDEDDQSFEIIGLLDLTWKDEYAKWNPASFGGVSQLQVPSDMLWSPTMKLIPGHFTRNDEEMAVKSDGTAFRAHLSKFGTKCRVSAKATTATCKVVFMPWAHDASEINLIVKPLLKIPGMFIESNQWVLESHESVKHEVAYPCCPGVKYPDATFTLNLKKVV